MKPPSFETYLKLVGSCSLLALLTGHYRMSEEDLECIERALNQCAEESEGSLRVTRSGNNLYLEPVR